MKTIIIDGVIGWDFIASDFRDAINEASGDNLDIQISSPGGSVFEGNTIYDLIVKYKNNFPLAEVTITSYGISASMASIIALAGDKHIVFSNTTYVIHNTRTISGGDKYILRKNADILDSLDNISAKIYVNKSRKSIREIKSIMDEETFYYGQEIVNAGFADEMILQENDESKKEEKIAFTKNAIEETIFKMQNEKNYDFYTDCFKAVAMIEPESPYPNEHSARIKDPKNFQKNSFRRKNIKKGIDTIIGKLKNETKMTIQAYRFDAKIYTVEQAKKWLKDHNIKYISFEPASGKSSSINDEECETCNIISNIENMENFHKCIYENSDNFDPKSFRVKVRKNEEWPDGSGKLRTIHLLIAKPKGKSKSSDPTKLVEFRYPIKEWTLSEARAHCKHNKGKSFEKADKQAESWFYEESNIPASAGKNNNTEVIMNLEDFKKENPDLYAQVVQIGKDQERDRVKAHLTLAKQANCLDIAVKHIEDGTEFTNSVTAEYMAAGMKNQSIQNRKDDNVDTGGGQAGDDDKADTEAYKNELLKIRGVKNVK